MLRDMDLLLHLGATPRSEFSRGFLAFCRRGGTHPLHLGWAKQRAAGTDVADTEMAEACAIMVQRHWRAARAHKASQTRESEAVLANESNGDPPASMITFEKRFMTMMEAYGRLDTERTEKERG